MTDDFKIILKEPRENTRVPIKRKLPFAAEKNSDLFFREFILLLTREFDARRKKYVSTENLQILYHGKGWSFQRHEKDGYKPHTGELGIVSNTCSVNTDRIMAHDLTLVSDFIREIGDKMENNFSEMVRAMISNTAKESGNTISIPKDGSYAEALLEMIKGIEYMVDATGNVSLPMLTCSPEMIEKLSREIEERGPEFLNAVHAAREGREKHALAKEAERLARFDLQE